MYQTIFNKYGINQLGFVVDDLEKTAKTFAEVLGAGPFFYVPLSEGAYTYRGKDASCSTELAYGQFGDLQIELIKVLSDGPSVYRENTKGIHHVSIWVDNFDKACEFLNSKGFERAMYLENSGMRIAYYDCLDELGFFVEFHLPMDALHEIGKELRGEWDGTKPYRLDPYGD